MTRHTTASTSCRHHSPATTATTIGTRLLPAQTPMTAAIARASTWPSDTRCHHVGRPSRYARLMSMTGIRPIPVVPGGPRAFRYRLRRTGGLVALVPAGALGLLSILLLRNNTSTVRGVLGFAAAVLAAP